jgi:hypothetical protein
VTDFEVLKLFVKRAEELRTSTFIQKGFVPSLQVERSGTAPANTIISEPDENDFRSFLLTYRQFISNKEPIYIYKVFKLCGKHITDPTGRRLFASARGKWKALERGGTLQLVENGRKIPSTEIQDLWINGYYFHNDPDKSRRLNTLSNGFQKAFRYQFLAHVYEATRVILYVADQLTYAFKVGAVKTP